MTLTDCEFELSATSVACTDIVFPPGLSVTEQLNDPAWMVAAEPLQVTAETPERASETLPVTERLGEVTVAPFAGEVMLNTGGVLSSLIVAAAEALLPATSVAVPEII